MESERAARNYLRFMMWKLKLSLPVDDGAWDSDGGDDVAADEV